MTLISAPPFEIIFVDVAAMFLTVATIWGLLKTTPRDEVRDVSSFFVIIIVIVPFVMLIYFGSAVISYDAMIQRSGWPTGLPLEPLWPREILAGAVIYTGLTLWLWWRWRKLRAD